MADLQALVEVIAELDGLLAQIDDRPEREVQLFAGDGDEMVYQADRQFLAGILSSAVDHLRWLEGYIRVERAVRSDI
jgi:hypothetical protein